VSWNPITGNAAQQGILKPFTGTDPAANAEISEAVPAGKWWEILAISVLLVQGATQTPQPTITVDDGTTVFFASLGASSAQNASVTTRYTWAPGLTLSAGGAATSATAPLPSGLILPAGYRIKTVTAGKGANTDYGAPQFFVRELG
jgi:hypothetical protein